MLRIKRKKVTFGSPNICSKTKQKHKKIMLLRDNQNNVILKYLVKAFIFHNYSSTFFCYLSLVAKGSGC